MTDMKVHTKQCVCGTGYNPRCEAHDPVTDITKVHTKQCVCGTGYNPRCEAHYSGEHQYLRARDSWARWLLSYGPEKFYDSFMRNAQGAESRCIYCRQPIFLDIAEGGGVPDWRTNDGDYGCDLSPDSTDAGVGSHFPEMKE